MKMFIPEIGTRILLIEDFTFVSNAHSVMLNKGVKLSVKKISIKLGQYYNNCVYFSVLRCKENKDCIYIGEILEINIYELNEMEFEIEGCNDVTKKLALDTLCEIKDSFKYIEDYRKIESVILGGKNLISFSPQQTPTIYYKSVLSRIDKATYEINKYYDSEKLKTILNKYIRKNKINNLLD